MAPLGRAVTPAYSAGAGELDFRTGLQLGLAQYMVKEARKGDDTAPSSGSPATSKGQNKLASVISGAHLATQSGQPTEQALYYSTTRIHEFVERA